MVLQFAGVPAEAHVSICAIGASAGGVAALRILLRQLPVDLGMAYVVILNHSPENPAALAQTLRSCTPMDVLPVDDSVRLTADCVYIIPPDRELLIKGDQITARSAPERNGPRAPVDQFFRSVAQARGDGLAVILSGSGADGSNGLRAIHEGGGVIFAQEPAEAEFPPMPQNAIATGLVNFVAPIPRLAERIAEMAYRKRALRSFDVEAEDDELRRILGLLRARTGHDFSSYKRATVMRRIVRRMQVCGPDTLAAYGELVRTNPDEAQELFCDLLISVTHFFRDPVAFGALERHILAPLLQSPAEEGVRIWVAGCATGEEAYSLAILMLEQMEERRVKVPVQIFASDLDERALRIAREGRYPRSIEADVSEERLRRFFVDERTHYRIRREVRDLVLFASHSVLKDPPFLRLDLVSCRNLLIYLEHPLQHQVLQMFHYGLRPHGFLFLGAAETAEASTDIFAPLDRESRIYSARDDARRELSKVPRTSVEAPSTGPDRAKGRRRPAASASDMHARALETVAPPSVLVDDRQEILHMSEHAGRFLLHTAGPYSARLATIVRPELRLDLEVAMNRALDKGLGSITHPVPVEIDGAHRRVALHVSPVPGSDDATTRTLVLFLDAGPAGEGESYTKHDINEDARLLRAELRAAQEALVASRSEHQIAMNDLRAVNDVLQSVNEGYRATSEELETSKEELQSMNEEFQTVNSELQVKLANISTAHSDLQNLTSATEIGTLFLDGNLRIRMFTAPISDLFNITETDIGRAITDFTHRLNYDAVEVDAGRVLRDLVPIESELQSRDGRWLLMRLRPYRTVEDRIDGVVLTFVDITNRRETEQQLLESRERYQVLFNSIDEGFCLIDVIFDEDDRPYDFRFVDVNATFERQTGLEGVVGRTIREFAPNHEQHWFDIYGRIVRSGIPERFQAPAAALGRHFELYGFPHGIQGSERVGVLFRDVTQRKVAEEQREMLTHELSHRVKNTLAVVQALARQPGTPQMSVETYRDRLIGRIQALSRAHEQLLETSWESADLKLLVEATLNAYGRIGDRGIVIDGPILRLTPKQGLGLSLILHELATNASKYGALSVSDGNLSIAWAIAPTDGERHLHLTWSERDGPEIPATVGKGFGTTLIERASTYELDGNAVLDFLPEGLQARISFPFPNPGLDP